MHTLKIISSIALIIAAVFIAGTCAQNSLASTSKHLDSQISAIEKSMKDGMWEDALNKLKALTEDWEKAETSWSMLLDHQEVDNIDSTIARMSQYIENRDISPALAEIETLRLYIRHIPEKEALTLKNIL
ncbi:DUF4363 family protein [Pseudoclostridium thermosuccinogenes]|uniref:DUF4363 family protein n=1 Tax=Clostridium thermosuccinogenes TaxID=84032 RepID=UPI0013794C64|nr:DUF4363 family protein [Pseudoclostridium thermosuccinogenes]